MHLNSHEDDDNDGEDDNGDDGDEMLMVIMMVSGKPVETPFCSCIECTEIQPHDNPRRMA